MSNSLPEHDDAQMVAAVETPDVDIAHHELSLDQLSEPGYLAALTVKKVYLLVGRAVRCRNDAALMALNREILTRQPTNLKAAMSLAGLLYRNGQWEEALALRLKFVNEGDEQNSRAIIRIQEDIAHQVSGTLTNERKRVSIPFFKNFRALLAEPQYLQIVQIHFLHKCAYEAAAARDWEACRIFELEILRRNPQDQKAQKLLARCNRELQEKGGYAPTQVRHVAPSPILPPVPAPAKARTPRPLPSTPPGKPPAPPEIRANLDRSRFDMFLESLARAMNGWEAHPSGNKFIVIPKVERGTLRALLQSFRDELEARGLSRKKSKNDTKEGTSKEEAAKLDKFWHKFDSLENHIRNDKIHPDILAHVVELLPVDVDWSKGDYASRRDEM